MIYIYYKDDDCERNVLCRDLLHHA